MNAKLHAVTDGYGRPVALLLSEGQMGDHKGAALLLNSLPPAKQMIAGRGYDSTWYREALRARGITPCISSRKNRKIPAKYSKTLYKKRYKVECMFGKFKDWRRISKRYDCCAHVIWPAHTFCTSRN